MRAWWRVSGRRGGQTGSTGSFCGTGFRRSILETSVLWRVPWLIYRQCLTFAFLRAWLERVVFREFYPKGLTALDVLDEAALGVRPTLSHASAQLEVHELIEAILNPQPGQAEQPDKTQAA